MTKTVLVTGASGLLGRQVQKVFHRDGWRSIGTGLSRISPPEIIKLDIQEAEQIESTLDEHNPDVIVHCAANRFPDQCSANPSAAKRLNVDSSRALASAAVARNIFLIYISTDYVFSGKPGEAPYSPDSPTAPPNTYGQTKLDGEKAVLEVAAQHANIKNRIIVLRVPILYGSCDEPKESAVNVLMAQLWNAQNLGPGEPKIQIDDYARRYPTNTADVGRVCRDLAKMYLSAESAGRELPQILHFSSEDCMTKWDVVKVFAEIMGLPLDGLEPFRPEEGEKDGVVRPFDCHLDTRGLRDIGVDVGAVDFRTWWRREVGAFRH